MSIQFPNTQSFPTPGPTPPANDSNSQSTNPSPNDIINAAAANNSSAYSTETMHALQQAQGYAADLLRVNQQITNIIQNAQPTGQNIDATALANAQAQQTLDFQLLQSAMQGLQAQLSPADLQALQAALSDTTPLLQQAQQTAKQLSQDTVQVNNILAQINGGNFSTSSSQNTSAPSRPNTLPTLQTQLTNALTQKYIDANRLNAQINALDKLKDPNNPDKQLQQLKDIYAESMQNLESYQFNTTANNPYSAVYQTYIGSLNNNVLANLGLTTPQIANPAWVTLTSNGSISTLNNPQALYTALQQQLNTYFPGYNSNNNSFTLQQNNVLYPAQPSPTIAGSSWGSVQSYAIQLGYLSPANATTTPPTPLPSYIQAVPNSSPTSYVVTLDPSALQAMISATAPFQSQTTPLTSDQTVAWQLSFELADNAIASVPTKTQNYLNLQNINLSLTSFSQASANAFNVYSPYKNNLTNNILDYLGLTPQPTAGTDPNWGKWVNPVGNVNNLNSTLTASGLSDLKTALNTLLTTYFPNYSNSDNTFTLQTNNVLYPVKSPITGDNWQNVQAFALQMGYMPQSDTSPAAPATLPAYIQIVPGSNPKTYVVTLDPTPLQSMIGATSALPNSPDAAATTAWLKVFEPNANNMSLTGTVLQYPYIPDSIPNQVLSQSNQSIMGLMSTMVSQLQTQYLQPQPNAASVFTAFYRQFNSQVYNRLSEFLWPQVGIADSTAGNYLTFHSLASDGGFMALVNQFYNGYFDGSGHANATKAVLYPPQTSNTISSTLSTGKTVTLQAAIDWATSFGLSPDQVGTASSPGRCIMQVGSGYVVQIDPQPIQNIQNSNPPNGHQVLIQKYQAWDAAFESNVSNIKNQLQLFAQSAQNALSTYQSRSDLYSSLIDALYKALQQVINNF